MAASVGLPVHVATTASGNAGVGDIGVGVGGETSAGGRELVGQIQLEVTIHARDVEVSFDLKTQTML